MAKAMAMAMAGVIFEITSDAVGYSGLPEHLMLVARFVVGIAEAAIRFGVDVLLVIESTGKFLDQRHCYLSLFHL